MNLEIWNIFTEIKDDRILRLVMLCDGEFNSGIVCELVENENSCGIKSTNYSIWI